SAIDTVDAACRAAGAIRLSTPGEVVELAGFFASSWLPAARRVAIVSDSGGQGAIAADTAEGFGLSVEILDPATAEKAAAHLPESGGVANPLALDGAGEMVQSVYSSLVCVVLFDDAMAAVVFSGCLAGYGEFVPVLLVTLLAEVDRFWHIVSG